MTASPGPDMTMTRQSEIYSEQHRGLERGTYLVCASNSGVIQRSNEGAAMYDRRRRACEAVGVLVLATTEYCLAST